jgi:hypothetical protein
LKEVHVELIGARKRLSETYIMTNLKVHQSKILQRNWQPKGKITAPSFKAGSCEAWEQLAVLGMPSCLLASL